MIERRRALWLRSVEAEDAWSGLAVAELPDARLLPSDSGRGLGFCRLVARRGEARALEFGLGEFAGAHRLTRRRMRAAKSD